MINRKAIGLLSPFYLMHYDKDIGVEVTNFHCKEKQLKLNIKNGIKISNNIILRLTSSRDFECLAPFSKNAKSVTPYSVNKYVLECSFDIPNSPEIRSQTSKKIINLIKKTITAMRLLKEGYVDSNCIFWLPSKDSQSCGFRIERSIPNPPLCEEYQLRTDELDYLKELLEKIIPIDFNKEKQLNVALRRFENSYYDTEDEDKLIDYMIAFEALFTTKKDRAKGRIIAEKCSKLLGKNDNQIKQIKKILREAYDIRNSIVHGETITITEKSDTDDPLFLEDFVIEVEKLLRKTIRKKIE